MRMTKFISLVAAASLLASSTIASAAPAGAALGVAASKQVRTATPIRKANKLEGGIDGTVFVIFLLLAGGIFIAVSGGGGTPNSP